MFSFKLTRAVFAAALLPRASPKKPLASVFSQAHLLKFRSSPSCFIAMAYTVEARGPANSLDYRLFFRNKEGTVISPFHDIPLYADKENNVFNMVVEVPRWTNAKMEIDTKSKMNPIKQDVKKGKLRFVKNCFPYHGYIWNYGALPQTWEDPNHTDASTSCKGDNDPLDVCEIGRKVAKRGSVIQVKVLGVMALIDEGETDWKILAIDVTDPLANDMNDIDDIERLMPGFIKATRNWFRIYKVPDGKPLNEFAFEGNAKNREFALGIIKDTAAQWQKLVSGASDAAGLSCSNVTVADSPFALSAADAQEVLKTSAEPGEALPRDPEVDDNNHFVKE